MGKKLVIKGADFSANAINESADVWYTDFLDHYTPTSNANLVNGGWAHNADDNSLVQNKPINRIRLVPSQAGTFKIGVASAYLSASVTNLATITIEAGDVGTQVTKTFPTINIGNGILVFGEANSAGGFKFANNEAQDHPAFISKVPSEWTGYGTSLSVSRLCIDVGYYHE